jgi:ABC-type Fe3+/spermidine/putrescine transport system ATPase subunit
MGVKITLKEVSKAWPRFKLKDINLEVRDGEYFVLLGPTGSGKTLLLETLMGFHNPHSGDILIDDEKLGDIKAWENEIVYLPQISNISYEMTVRQNIEYVLDRREITDRWKRAVDGIITVMGLSDIEDRPAVYLSGGERRKVSLARALILEPQAVLLDEPLNNIDEEKKRELQKDLQMIHEYLNLTVIHVTHDRFEAYSLADRMGLMKNGRILQVGTPKEIWYSPNNRDIASFIGYENIIETELIERRQGHIDVSMDSKKIRVLGEFEGKKFNALIWNQDITISRNYYKKINENLLGGEITEIIDLGSLVEITTDIGVPIKSTMGKREFKEKSLKIGEQVWLNIKPEDITLIPL